MFRRIRNLWKLGAYRVEEKIELTANGHKKYPPTLIKDYKPVRKMATIVDLKPKYDPLNEFENETTK